MDRTASILVLAFLGLFFVLSIDSLVRLWSVRHGMAGPLEAALVLSYQLAHATITLLGTILTSRILWRAETHGTPAFGWLLAFLTLWYTKAFGYASFPGPFQSSLAEALFATGFPRLAASLLFGAPWWAAWLALGAALRISVCYPRSITMQDIEAPGARDRTGLLRSVALAGLDVGSALRRAAATALRLGLLRSAVVWPVTLGLGIAASLMTAPTVGFLALYGCGIALVITNLRAGLNIANGLERRRLLWVVQAGLTASLAFALAGVLSFAGDRAADLVSFAVTAIAPLAVLASAGIGARPGHPPDPRAALRNTASRGAVAVISALAYVAARPIAASTGWSQIIVSLLGLGVAIITALLVWNHVRASAARMITPAFARRHRRAVVLDS